MIVLRPKGYYSHVRQNAQRIKNIPTKYIFNAVSIFYSK